MILPVTAFISPGGSEFLLIMLVLILLFGAKDAPRIFRSIHDILDKMQRAAASFRYRIMYGDLQDTPQEAPYDVTPSEPDESEECAELEAEPAEPSADTEPQDSEACDPVAADSDPETRNA